MQMYFFRRTVPLNCRMCLSFLQSKGDRLFLDEELTLELSVIETLKKMNSNYPKNTSDFDAEFIFKIMKPMFSRQELKNCVQTNSLHSLKKGHRCLLKGLSYIFIYFLICFYPIDFFLLFL